MSTPVIAKLMIRPLRVAASTRSHFFAPIFCAAIELIAPPTAMAGICT